MWGAGTRALSFLRELCPPRLTGKRVDWESIFCINNIYHIPAFYLLGIGGAKGHHGHKITSMAPKS